MPIISASLTIITAVSINLMNFIIHLIVSLMLVKMPSNLKMIFL